MCRAAASIRVPGQPPRRQRGSSTGGSAQGENRTLARLSARARARAHMRSCMGVCARMPARVHACTHARACARASARASARCRAYSSVRPRAHEPSRPRARARPRPRPARRSGSSVPPSGVRRGTPDQAGTGGDSPPAAPWPNALSRLRREGRSESPAGPQSGPGGSGADTAPPDSHRSLLTGESRAPGLEFVLLLLARLSAFAARRLFRQCSRLRSRRPPAFDAARSLRSRPVSVGPRPAITGRLRNQRAHRPPARAISPHAHAHDPSRSKSIRVASRARAGA